MKAEKEVERKIQEKVEREVKKIQKDMLKRQISSLKATLKNRCDESSYLNCQYTAYRHDRSYIHTKEVCRDFENDIARMDAIISSLREQISVLEKELKHLSFYN